MEWKCPDCGHVNTLPRQFTDAEQCGNCEEVHYLDMSEIDEAEGGVQDGKNEDCEEQV